MLNKLKQKNDEFIAKKQAEAKAVLDSPEGQAKIKQQLEKYGLNIGEYTDTEMQLKNLINIKKVTDDLFGNGLTKAGMALSFAKAEEQAKVGYLSALVEQNWIIIRQNEAILRSLNSRTNSKAM